jgi:hypothetical protein
MTISAAAFGRQITWEDDEPHPGHDLSFKQSIEAVGTGLLIRLLCPKWIFEWAPTEKIREARDGFAEFRVRSPPTRSRAGILQLILNSMRVVIFSGDDQRMEAIQ